MSFPAVQRLNSTGHWINHYQLDNTISFGSTYPLDSIIQPLNEHTLKSKDMNPIYSMACFNRAFFSVSGFSKVDDVITIWSAHNKVISWSCCCSLFSFLFLLIYYIENQG